MEGGIIRRRRYKKTILFIDLLFFAVLVANVTQMAYDWEYWQKAPQPYYLFLLAQMTLLILVVRIPMSVILKPRYRDCLMGFLVISLFTNTVCGTVWLIRYRKDYSELYPLKTSYFVESIILLSIPYALLFFFFILLATALTIVFLDYRRN